MTNIILLVCVVRANAKIHILKQFTTASVRYSSHIKLYVLMQRYTFWSNSQLLSKRLILIFVVRANAKIHILKQFTTEEQNYHADERLYVLMQRYTFWSNSQQLTSSDNLPFVVRANAKIHILKQFTTINKPDSYSPALYVLMQRYTFWSNSQLALLFLVCSIVVRANAKIHILKQFTTFQSASSNAASLYVLMQRYTFWSNSQLLLKRLILIFCCTC